MTLQPGGSITPATPQQQAWQHQLSREGRVEIPQPRSRLLLFTLGAAVFMALGVLMLMTPLSDASPGPRVGWQLFGVLLALGTAALVVAYVKRLVTGGGITVDSAGVRSSVHPRNDVPWTAMVGSYVWTNGSNQLVIIDLDPEWAEQARQARLLRGVWGNARYIGRHAICLPFPLRADAHELTGWLQCEIARRSGSQG